MRGATIRVTVPFGLAAVVAQCFSFDSSSIICPQRHVASDQHRRVVTSLGAHDAETDHSKVVIKNHRRLLLSTIASGAISTVVAPAKASAVGESNGDAVEKNESNNDTSANSSLRLSQMLHRIPTFCIVDQQGVPYMVVGEDAKVTGYFFTTYQEADRLLQLAKKSADQAIKAGEKDPEQTEKLVNPWKSARVSTVPMDVAFTVISKSSSYSAKKGNYFWFAPADADVDDALALTGDADLAEGKVPLFYFPDFLIENETPLYFSKAALEDSYRRQYQKGTTTTQDLPTMAVTELTATIRAILTSKDEDIRQVTVVPPADSARLAAACDKRQAKTASNFVVGQRNLVL